MVAILVPINGTSLLMATIQSLVLLVLHTSRSNPEVVTVFRKENGVTARVEASYPETKRPSITPLFEHRCLRCETGTGVTGPLRVGNIRLTYNSDVK